MLADQVKDRLPYRLRQQFLSYTELVLFSALQKIADGRYIVCPKVALNDLFYIQRPNENVHFYNKIFRKHVDFLLCEPQSMKPAFGVEVIKPVAKEETRAVDQYMQELFLSAGLPLVHVRSRETYELGELVQMFKQAVEKTRQAGMLYSNDSPDSAPCCPQCGLVMVLRIYRTGPRAGKRYYGCMSAPACNGLIPID